jgi:DNA repair protein RecO (recombination protein O)
MVAKGAKRPYSILRPVLSAFQPLALSWTGSGEVKTLTRAEVAGIHMLAGAALMSGWYMNELLLRLLPREDAHPVLFDAYDTALTQLAAGSRAAAALRRFEWTLLRETGYGVDQSTPDFDDPLLEPSLRRDLRARLTEQLGSRPLITRRVLMDLQKR